MEAVEKELKRAQQKQRELAKSTLGSIDTLLVSFRACEEQLRSAASASASAPTAMDTGGEGEDHVAAAAAAAAAGVVDPKKRERVGDAVSELSKRMRSMVPTITKSHKELHVPIAKLSKAVDKTFHTTFSSICRADMFQGKEKHLNEVIAEHLFREGRFDLGQTFLQEANLELSEAQREGFMEMDRVLKALQTHKDLGPAIAWADAHAAELDKRSSALAFKLHRLRFIELLRPETQLEATTYASTHLLPHCPKHFSDVKRLMGALLYVRHLSDSLYADLLEPIHWLEASQLLAQNCCSLMGLSQESPLAVSLTLGCTAVPHLMKAALLLQKSTNEGIVWAASGELPVEIAVGRERQYHSVFVCPVSHEQTSAANPPMRLPCGHVISKASLTNMAKNARRKFKCTYCTSEQLLSEAVEIIL